MRWLAPLLVAVTVAAGAAAPQVEIKAQTQLSLGTVRLVGAGEVEVTGQLLDRLTGEGIENQQIVVRVAGHARTAWTNSDGKFRTTLEIFQLGPQPVSLEFRGTSSLDRADPLSVVTDPSRAQVALSVRAEHAPGGATLLVSATVDDKVEVVPVELAVGAPGAAELQVLETIDSGSEFLLTRKAAGGLGQRRVRVTFKGDEARQAATAEATIEMASSSRTTMKVASLELAYEDDLEVTGKVVDEDDRPVARAAVTLKAGDRRLAQGATTSAGVFEFDVEAEILGEGQFGIAVEADPAVPYIRPSKTENPAIITIAAPQPVPVSYTIAALAITVLAAGGFFAARSKPWLRLRRPSPPAEQPEPDGVTEVIDGGLVVNKPGLVSTLRRPYDEGFSGVVRDTVRGRPVPEAVVRLLQGDQEREHRTAADGSFALEKLAMGEWRAEVAAPGHVTEAFVVSIPHRGELRGVRVDLVPVRERVFQLYRRAAEPALPEARLWGIWSPRQIVDHVRSRRPSPALADLTDFVEEVYFSARVAAETVIPHASERVDQAIRERTRAAVQA